jgi:hypothetical protein
MCVDHGKDLGAPNHDRDGGFRPDVDVPYNENTDIGAYEYGYSLGALAATLPDGTVVEVYSMLVSAMFPQWGRIYVQRMDRVSGIRVDTSNTYTIGHTLRIRGTLQTDATLAERYIVPLTGWPQIYSGNNVYSLGMNNLWINQSAANTRPLADGSIPFCSAGLLTQTWGRVTNVYPSVSYFTITDGSTDISYWGGNADVNPVSVNVLLPSGGTMPAVGSFVKVTGINGNMLLGGTRYQGIKTRTQSDIVTVTSWVSSQITGLATGSNLLAIPGIPRYPDPETVFYGCPGGPGIQLTWYLQRWVVNTQNWMYYGYCGEAPWGNCVIGEGYSLTIPSDGNHCYVYDRTPVTGDQILYLPLGSNPQGKLEFIGNPFDANRPWSGVKVSDGVTLMTLQQAISAGWIHSVLKWNGGAWVTINTSTESMEARKGYLVYPSRNGLSMQVWAP